MGRMCVIIFYGLVSLDSWKNFVLLQGVAALSETHASWSLSLYPDASETLCPIFMVLFTVMIIFPTITSMLLKYLTLS